MSLQPKPSARFPDFNQSMFQTFERERFREIYTQLSQEPSRLLKKTTQTLDRGASNMLDGRMEALWGIRRR